MYYLIIIIGLFLIKPSYASDLRYCGFIERDAFGSIKRNQKVLNDFQKLYPCPSTGKETGSCPGWAKDHV